MTKVSHHASAQIPSVVGVDGLVEGTPSTAGANGLFGNLLGIFGQAATGAASIVSEGWLNSLASRHGVNRHAMPQEVVDESPIADTVHGAEGPNQIFGMDSQYVILGGVGIAGLVAVALIARG